MLSLFPLAVSAQDGRDLEDGQQIGTRFLREPESVEAGQARWMQKMVALCMYRINRDEIDEILAHSDFHRIDFNALGLDSDTALSELSMGHCIGRAMRDRDYSMRMSYQFSTMRNLLAEEAYLRNNRNPITLASNATESLAAQRNFVYPNIQTQTIAQVADCVTYRNLPAADALLRSRPASNGEAEAFDALSPTFADCLNTDQSEVMMSISLVRQIVADGLWSRSHYGASAAEES